MLIHVGNFRDEKVVETKTVTADILDSFAYLLASLHGTPGESNDIFKNKIRDLKK